MSAIQNLIVQLQQGTIGQWYAAKSPTDRLIIKILSGLIAATIVYVAVWKPLSDYNQEQQARHVTELALSEWIILNRESLRRSAKRPTSGNSAPALIPSITSAANQNRLKLERLQSESDGGVSIALQDQQFNQVLKWLTLLESNQGLNVERLSIDRADKSSRVNGQVKLTN